MGFTSVVTGTSDFTSVKNVDFSHLFRASRSQQHRSFDKKDQEDIEKERHLVWLKDHDMLDFTILGYELLSLWKGDLQKMAVR